MRRIFFLISILICSFIVKADDGMWIPLLLKGYTIQDMQKKGFMLTDEDIYSVNHSSLKDAVIIFGGGCTGEIISSKGMILTNHHCGYSAVHSVSTLENDYLTNGFWAMTQEEEMPINGLSVRFLDFIQDVTEDVLKDVKSDDTEQQRTDKISKVIDELITKYNKDDFTEISIEPFYYGNQYFMYVYKVYKDIRLIGAPPSSIGKFGGDTDNWMWPRHTGDFSMFRVYVSKNNEPAEYSADNVPLTPKKSLKISLKGVNEGDFTMVMGYPGRTQEYLPSIAIKSIMQVQNPIGIKLRNIRLQEMRKYMETDPAIRLMYAAKYARVANYWKKWIGENKGLYTVNAIDKKINFEKKLTNWINADKERQQIYGGILQKYEDVYHNMNPYYKIGEYLNEGLFSIELIRYVKQYKSLEDFNSKNLDEQKEIREKYIKSVRSFYKNFNKDIDLTVFLKMMDEYNKNITGDARFFVFKKMNEKISCEKSIKSLYVNSIFTDSTKLITTISHLDKHELKTILEDSLYLFYNEMVNYYRKKIKPVFDKNKATLDSLNRLYMAVQMEFEKDRHFYPDANFTMRVAYGQVKGFEPRDGVVYKPFTTLKGVIEKDDTTVYDYVVDEKLKTIYKNKDFGNYANSDGSMPVCFIATNHTTGGNSGSPVFDARGNLIGINFDRNWEGTMSDIYYDSSLCRNISLDIRYFLLIVDKFAGDKRLINEMEFVK